MARKLVVVAALLVSAAGLTMLAISGGRHTSELLMRVNREQMRSVQMLGRIDGRADYAPLIGGEGGYGYEFAGALPPSNWGVNFDGSNFIEPEAYVNGGLVDEPSMDGDYWLAATGDDPSNKMPLSEGLGPTFADMHWNEYTWCGSSMCDYSSPDTEEYPHLDGDFSAGVGMRPL